MGSRVKRFSKSVFQDFGLSLRLTRADNLGFARSEVGRLKSGRAGAEMLPRASRSWRPVTSSTSAGAERGQ